MRTKAGVIKYTELVGRFLSRRILLSAILLMNTAVFSVNGNAVTKVQVKYSNEGITIAEKGRAKSLIVLGKDAVAPEKTAARELAEYLKKATGAEFTIVAEGDEKPTNNLIYVGPTKYALENGLDPDLLGEEQWFVHTANGSLVLAGGRPRGTLYAVYHFLEDVVGVHWWSPWEEFVPDRKKLATGKLNLSGEPSFKARMLDSINSYHSASGQESLFAPRNRVNRQMSGSGWFRIPFEYGGDYHCGPPNFVHTEGQYLQIFSRLGYFKEHPEWLALKNGKREIHEQWTANQLCLSNQEMRKAFLKELRKNIQETRGQDVPPRIFDVSLNDIPAVCQCEDCTAIVKKYGNSDTGLLLEFVNYMADGVKEDYPDILISTLAYLNTEHVPAGILPRYNVLITLCDTKSTYTAPIPKDGYLAGRLKDWAKVANNISIWDYHTTFSDPALPLPLESTFQTDLRLFRKYNVIGVMTEFHYPIFEDMRDLRLWLLAKLYENPYQDQNELIKTFTDGFYGPAAGFIREYIKMVQDAAIAAPCYAGPAATMSSLKYVTPDFVVKVQNNFDRAEQAVRNSDILLRRVRHARLAIDKATLAIFPRIWQQWVAEGKKPDDIPVNRDKIAARLKETVAQQWQLRAANLGPDWAKKDSEAPKKEFLDSIDKYLSKKLIMIKPSAKFASLPEGSYKDYPADSMNSYPGNFGIIRVEEDRESEAGITIRREFSDKELATSEGGPATEYKFMKDYVLAWDLHDYTKPAKGNEPTIRYLKAEEVPAEGYHWYKLGTYPLSESNFLWVYNVGLEIGLRDARDPLDVTADYDIWARIKFAGPAFPHGKKDQANAICVERITVVKAGKITKGKEDERK